ncbi:beta-galactosidase [Mycoplasmatota bacterium]|nr:beta-galactosidase [Mycoplasmatota bacterium]
MSIVIKGKKIYINGEPTLIQAGEIHYYRLKQSEWQKRIDDLKSTGMNAVASYIPWLCHEEEENQFDFEGKTHEELNLIKFLKMVEENGLYFIARPGPFVMAEMKNDGIPYWVREKYPHLIPKTWDGNKATTVTLDYLNEDFLHVVKKWYGKVIPLLKEYSINEGGNLIACQLDNEIGMLSWVSNNPDLTDTVLQAFRTYLRDKYENPCQYYDFINEDFSIFVEKIRKPEESYVTNLHVDLGEYMRIRTIQYVNILKEYAEMFGLKDIPFLINIHGTGGGRAMTYPIGISQLYKTYHQDNSFIAGSDVYFDDLTVPRLVDSYMANILTNCVNNEDQPLTSLEFNAGSNNFGDDYGGRVRASSNNLRVRLFIAQGNRLLNYYLFNGGTNYRFNKKRNDGNDRIATTGEEHGYAAPIGPKGEKTYLFDKLSQATKLVNTYKDKLASAVVLHDTISFAFIPDYFMTEFSYPKSQKIRKIHDNIARNRANFAWDSVCRAMLLLNYQFNAVNIQDNEIDSKHTKVLILPSSLYMAKKIQEKIVKYLASGGKVLLYGEVPMYDLEGNACSILANVLGVKFNKVITDNQSHYIPSVECANFLKGLKAYHVYYNLAYHLTKGHPILKLYDTDETVGFEINNSSGHLIGITCQYPCHLDAFERIFNRFGIQNRVRHTDSYHGVYILSTKNEIEEKFIHVLNLDDVKKKVQIIEDDEVLFEGNRIEIEENDGLLLPMNMKLKQAHIYYSTNEIIEFDEDTITFRLTGSQLVCKLKSNRRIMPGPFKIHYENDYIYIFKESRLYNEHTLVVQFK